jgi:hypothetical protein
MDLEANVNTENFNFIPREIKTNFVRVLEHGKDIEISHKEFQKKYGAFGLIRIPEKEFETLINPQVSKLTHFNLQVSSHKKGEKYLLVKILEHGNLDKSLDKEILPLLDISNPQLFECTECIENINYTKLKTEENIFENSFPNIKSIDSLKEEIINRYSKSMSYLSNTDILELGVSITKLKRVPMEVKNN